MLSQLGDPHGALKYNKQAIPLCEELVRDFPDVPGYRRNLAIDYLNLGGQLKATGDEGEGDRSLRKALEIYQTLLNQFPSVPSYRQEMAQGLHYFGDSLRWRDRIQEALPMLRQSSDLIGRLVKEFPRNASYRKDLNSVRYTISTVLSSGPDPYFRDPEESLRLARQLIDEAPEEWDHWWALGLARGRVGDQSGALMALDEASRRKPDDPGICLLRAEVLWKLEKRDQARSSYSRSCDILKALPANAEHHRKLKWLREEAEALLQGGDSDAKMPNGSAAFAR
jgi:tetratricopeptide (TPR) repeat protein